MVLAATDPPPGAPADFPIRHTTASGIQIVYGAPHSRQPPGVEELRGIGIKMRKQVSPDWDVSKYPDWESSWAGLYEQKLHMLFWNVTLRVPKRDVVEMVLHLPMMGMPPREPTPKLMRLVRNREPWSDWFRYVYVFPATAFTDCEIVINTTRPQGDDVIIKLPSWPSDNKDVKSSYALVERKYGFEFRTALPRYDEGNKQQPEKSLRTLYFIQLLPNELPSYHFFADPSTQPEVRPQTIGSWFREEPDGPGSPHAITPGALPSKKQALRSGHLSPKDSTFTHDEEIAKGRRRSRSSKRGDKKRSDRVIAS